MFGEHESASISTFADELGIGSPLIITDKYLLENGITQKVLDGLDDAGIKYHIYSDVPPDSDTECVNKASAYARDNGCDSLIAIGGGSVLDTAKVVNMGMSLDKNIFENQGLNIIQKKLNPLVAVPTTAGTGSEVSFVATIKDARENRKLVFGSRFLAPELAILDPVLTLSLPPKLTAATGMDALTHAIEALACSVTYSPFTESLAIEALRLLLEFLPRATECGEDMEARSNTLIASTMAGVAFTNSGVGIIHALAHATGAKFKTHHGMTNAIYLPHGMRFNKSESKDVYAKVSRALKFSDKESDDKASDLLIEGFEKLMQQLKIPDNLKELGIPDMNEQELESWSGLVLEDPAIMFNPRYATEEDVIEIFKRAY